MIVTQTGPTTRAQAAEEKTPVRAVQRAFELLAEVSVASTAVSQSELGRRLALPTSTVARLLSTLEGTGFIRRESGARFVPGIRLILMGLNSLRGSTLYDLAEPHLKYLRDSTRETANLAVRADADHWVYLRQVLSERTIHHASRIGRVLPLPGTAAGAALTGDLNPQGFAARHGTFEVEVASVAAPLILPGGIVAGALSVTAPAYRVDDAALQRIGPLVVEAARQLSLELGGAGARG